MILCDLMQNDFCRVSGEGRSRLNTVLLLAAQVCICTLALFSMLSPWLWLLPHDQCSKLTFSPLWVRAHPFDMAASIITQHGTFLSQPSGAFWIDFSSGLPHVGTGVWNWLCLYKMRTSPGHSSWNVCYTGCHCSVFVVVKSPLCGAHARAAGMIGSL